MPLQWYLIYQLYYLSLAFISYSLLLFHCHLTSAGAHQIVTKPPQDIVVLVPQTNSNADCQVETPPLLWLGNPKSPPPNLFCNNIRAHR